MKTLLLFILFFSSGLLFAQSDSVITYKDVVIVDGATQKDLFSKARQWFNNTFHDSKAVVSIDDKESGELSGKGVMKFNIAYQGRDKTMVPVTVEFKINTRVREGKYKYEFTDFDVVNFWNSINNLGILRSNQGKDWFGTKKWSGIAYQETKDGVNDQVNLLVASLKNEMKKRNDF